MFSAAWNFSASDFVNNIIAGIVASVATWLIVVLSAKISSWRKFSGLAGWYDQYSIDNIPIAGGRTQIRWLGKNLIVAIGTSPEGSWVSHIAMNESMPAVGSGFYQYNDRLDCGLHEIQYNQTASTIFVHVTNTSHGKNFTIAYLWRRADSGTAAAQYAARWSDERM